MTWRASAHDYTRAGVYHITIHVADGLGQPLGKVVGNLSAPDGTPDAPHTALSPIGQMVEQELLHTIHIHYPMIVVDTYAIMPEHLHFILEVQDRILSQNGKVQSLGQVIAGFKKGCNRRFWELTNINGGKTATHTTPSDIMADSQMAASVGCGFPEVYHPSATHIEQCAMGKLLIVTPWQYKYRKRDDAVSVPFCKTMNCVAQALCCTKDIWWKG